MFVRSFRRLTWDIKIIAILLSRAHTGLVGHEHWRRGLEWKFGGKRENEGSLARSEKMFAAKFRAKVACLAKNWWEKIEKCVVAFITSRHVFSIDTRGQDWLMNQYMFCFYILRWPTRIRKIDHNLSKTFVTAKETTICQQPSAVRIVVNRKEIFCIISVILRRETRRNLRARGNYVSYTQCFVQKRWVLWNCGGRSYCLSCYIRSPQRQRS